MNEELWKTLNKTCARLGIKPTRRIIFARIATQTLQLFDDGNLVRTYAISTSKRPPSNLADSLGTPRGLHEIAERIGEGQPPGMVFKSRQPTGHHFSKQPAGNAELPLGGRRETPPKPPSSSEQSEKPDNLALTENNPTGWQPVPLSNTTSTALITTRILWLRGLEPDVNLGGNVDSHDRYIYIHGTNREDLIGTPQSAGCVVMRNLEVIELYEQVRVGDMVLIA